MSKAYYNKISKIVKERDLTRLPSYDSFKWPKLKKGYEYVLVPLGLSLDRWDELLKNKSDGLWHSDIWPKSLFVPSGLRWQLYQVWAEDKPQETNISYSDVDKSKLVSAQVLIAQQWIRLELGLKSVDSDTWSMASETKDSYVAGVDWGPGVRRVRLGNWGAGSRFDYFGVRGAESSKTLEFDSSSAIPPTLDTSALELNTEAILKLTETLNRIFK